MAKRKTTKLKSSKRKPVDEKLVARAPAKNGNLYKSYYADAEPTWNRKVGGRTRFMICRNSIENGKYWKGKLCGNWVAGIGRSTLAVLCSSCSRSLVPYEEKYKKKSDKPRGWAFMKEYVHKDGTVYHKGKEQPELKGTLPPTVIKPTVPKKKISKSERQRIRQDLLVEFNKLKKQQLKETRKTYKSKIRTQMNKIQRELKKIK